MSYDPTILVCALLSMDSYLDENNAPGWKREAQLKASDEGLFAAAYSNRDNLIISVRGTQQEKDFMDDLAMTPGITGTKAEKALQELVKKYCLGTPADAAAKNVGAFAKYIFTRRGVQENTAKWGNSIPKTQARNAVTFTKQVFNLCKEKKLKLRCFTGHSLGGALAQYLSEQTGIGGLTEISEKIPAVVFNSPSMGFMEGMRKGSGGGILCINSRLDPLSLATKLAGNESHAKNKDYYILVNTLMPVPPPRLPEKPTTDQMGDFNRWFVRAILQHHSIQTLYAALCQSFPGSITLRHFFPNI